MAQLSVSVSMLCTVAWMVAPLMAGLALCWVHVQCAHSHAAQAAFLALVLVHVFVMSLM